MTQHTKRFAGLSVALLLVAAACSSGSSSADTTTTEPAGAEARATEATGPETIEVTAVDYGYAGLPETIRAGTKLTMINASDTEAHELVAIRLPDDEERQIGDLVQLPPEELGAFFPLVEAVILAPPGEAGIAVEGDGVLSEPGRYAIICVIPTGADPAEYMKAAAEAEGGPPDVAGGPPHIVNGMYAEVTVEG